MQKPLKPSIGCVAYAWYPPWKEAAPSAPLPIARRIQPNPLTRCQMLVVRDLRPPVCPTSASTSPAMLDHSAKDVTALLRAWGAGDSQASDAVAPLVYDELRRQAELALRRESDGHTLQTTALAHEAWLR